MRIKNWRSFQHYKHRNPPWIRFHRSLLDDLDWHKLDGDTAKTLVMLWLIASEKEGNLPSIDKLAFRLRLTETHLSSIISGLSHWLEPDASNALAPGSLRAAGDVLAPRSHRAVPETESEAETERRRRARESI